MQSTTIQKAGQTKYKYNLNPHIKRVKYENEITLDELCVLMGVAPRTLKRHRDILIGDPEDIPVGTLRTYAQAFEVELKELFNEPVEQPPISKISREAKVDDESTDISNQFNLS